MKKIKKKNKRQDFAKRLDPITKSLDAVESIPLDPATWRSLFEPEPTPTK